MLNEKSKKLMQKQVDLIIEGLETHFSLPILQDDLAEDEYKNLKEYKFFILVFGDMNKTGEQHISQEILVNYVSENNENIDEDTIDIVSLVSKVNAVDFVRTIKQRGQKKDTDEFVDQVTLVFNRKIKYDCPV